MNQLTASSVGNSLHVQGHGVDVTVSGLESGLEDEKNDTLTELTRMFQTLSLGLERSTPAVSLICLSIVGDGGSIRCHFEMKSEDSVRRTMKLSYPTNRDYRDTERVFTSLAKLILVNIGIIPAHSSVEGITRLMNLGRQELLKFDG